MGKAPSPTPGKPFGAAKKGATPVPGPPVRTKKPPVGFGSDNGLPKKNKNGGARD